VERGGGLGGEGRGEECGTEGKGYEARSHGFQRNAGGGL
jgi:hypothetical protein